MKENVLNMTQSASPAGQVGLTANTGMVRARRSRLATRIRTNAALYLFLCPAAAYVLIFNFAPLYGIQIAFKDFSPYLGIWDSPWAGLHHFVTFLRSPQLWTLLRNTTAISAYSLIAGFPIPILLALTVNYIGPRAIRKLTQTITYIPHFISTVVMVGMMLVLLSPRNGVVNLIINALGGESINFFGSAALFRHLYVWSNVWQHAGFSAVIYIASLSSVSPELYEAAIVDGATKAQRVIHIDLPTLLPTAVVLLILNAGNIMNVGFEKVFLMQNALNLEVSEVISTYVYAAGLQYFRFSYATAIGLFNNVINFVVLIVVNRLARKLTENSLW